MPRIGMNPGRGRNTKYRPSRITLAVLTYLPEQAGYFEHRFECTRLCIESLIANTPEPYDLMVFDNGSCKVLIDYLLKLREEKKIDYLFLSSRNIGKIGALRFIFNAAPGDIVAYTDDDVFFLPNWLESHLEILETYPRVGMVSGFYIRPHMSYGIKSTLAFAERPDVKKEAGFIIPKEWELHYVENTGRTWEKYNEEISGLSDVALEYKGVFALASAGHHQFVARRDVILEALPKEWGGQLMGQMRELDIAIDQLGYLRLSTRQPVTRLLGNLISSETAAEAQRLGLNAKAPQRRKISSFESRLYRLPLIRAVAVRLYNLTYRIIHE